MFFAMKTLKPGRNGVERDTRPFVCHLSRRQLERLLVIAPIKRCGFTIIAQDGLENDPEILRSVMKFGNRNSLRSQELFVLETPFSSPHDCSVASKR